MGDDTWDGLSPAWEGARRGPKKTIQAGVDVTIDGWSYTVQVSDGVYSGPGNREIGYGMKRITIKSEYGAATVVVQRRPRTAMKLLEAFTGATVRLTPGEADFAPTVRPGTCTLWKWEK